jgi:protein TonB
MAALAVSLLFHALLVAGFERYFGRAEAIAWPGIAPALRVTLRAAESTVLSERSAAPVREAGERATIPGRRYYASRELDVRPGIRTHTEPEYPEAAARRSLSGRVLIELYIDETGTVERVAILRAEPPGVFDASVKRAFSAARFTPGMKEGRPVPVLMTLEIEFESQRPQAQR